MKLKLFSVVFVMSTIIICLSTGAPPKQRKVKAHARGTRYSLQEEDFIIQELVSRASNYDHTHTWEQIQTVHNQKVLDKDNGFSVPRKAIDLKRRFPQIIKKRKEVPNIVKKLYTEHFARKFINRKERELINTELLSCDFLYSEDTWLKIEAKHDHLRESGCLGFENTRAAETLRTHFTHRMIPNGHVDKRIKERFPQHFTPKEGSTSIARVEQPDTGRSKNEAPDSDKEECFWDTVMTDMNQSQQSSESRDRRDNDIFESQSPCEPRQF